MSIDIERGTLVGTQSSAVRTVVGLNGGPEWSPDGKYLAYVSQRNPSGQGRRVVVITSIETGKTRELDIAMRYFGPIKWAPDGESFLVKGQDLKGIEGIHRIDAQTGKNTRLPLEPGPCQASPEWSPDGRKIYYSGGTDCAGREGSVLLERDMVTGAQREIVRGPGPQLLRLSPDGRFLAGARGAIKDYAVVLIPVAGGEPTRLLPLTDGRSVAGNGLSWAPDGRALIVTVQSKDGREFLLVPADGGPARRLEGKVQGPVNGGLRIHPNGRQAAFVTGEHQSEVWVLENFLPSVEKP
jgi:Tol biopolymer transport system component